MYAKEKNLSTIEKIAMLELYCRLRGCMPIHFTADKAPLFPYEKLFELQKLYLSLLRSEELPLEKNLGLWQQKQFTYTL